MSKVNAAILGFGTVGKGVYDIINARDNDIEVVKVLELRDIEEIKDIRVTDYREVVSDENIDVVVECLGGDDFPHMVNTACLKAGKSVVTSNKETTALHFDEYLSLAKENNCHYLFEASCGGGIPLLNPLTKIIRYDEITGFMGILNGTVNFIITKMEDEGYEFEDALNLAKQAGFAEKDPSADLLGLDVVRKCAIISDLCYNIKVDVEDIVHFGIENLNREIIDDIVSQGRHLKMVGISQYENGKLSLMVIPVIIDDKNPLSSVKEENNGIIVNCKFNDQLTFMGKGAGRYPTGGAIVQDIISIQYGPVEIDRTNAVKVSNQPKLTGTFYLVENGQKLIKDNPAMDELKAADFVAEIM